MYHTGRGRRTQNSNRREPIVEDLRDKLNRRRQEKQTDEEGGKTKPPPPDPSYNFLRDPLRGDECRASGPQRKFTGPRNHQNHNDETHPVNRENNAQQPNFSKAANSRNFGGNFKTRFNKNKWPARESDFQQNRRPHQNQTRNANEPWQLTFSKESASNILVELSNESGERKCTLDDSKTIEVPKAFKPRTPDHARRSRKVEQRKYVAPNNRNKAFEDSKHVSSENTETEKPKPKEDFEENNPNAENEEQEKKDVLEENKLENKENEIKIQNKEDVAEEHEHKEENQEEQSKEETSIHKEDTKQAINEDKEEKSAENIDTTNTAT